MVIFAAMVLVVVIGLVAGRSGRDAGLTIAPSRPAPEIDSDDRFTVARLGQFRPEQLKEQRAT